MVKIPKLNQEEAQGRELDDQGKRPSNTPAAHQAKAQYKLKKKRHQVGQHGPKAMHASNVSCRDARIGRGIECAQNFDGDVGKHRPPHESGEVRKGPFGDGIDCHEDGADGNRAQNQGNEDAPLAK